MGSGVGRKTRLRVFRPGRAAQSRMQGSVEASLLQTTCSQKRVVSGAAERHCVVGPEVVTRLRHSVTQQLVSALGTQFTTTVARKNNTRLCSATCVSSWHSISKSGILEGHTWSKSFETDSHLGTASKPFGLVVVETFAVVFVRLRSETSSCCLSAVNRHCAALALVNQCSRTRTSTELHAAVCCTSNCTGEGAPHSHIPPTPLALCTHVLVIAH